MDNVDHATVEGFGIEWSEFDQAPMSDDERRQIFDGYFAVFPWDRLPAEAEGIDVGCGSGRWATLVAERVGKLHALDASAAVLEVARRNLAHHGNVEFHHASVGALPFPDGSFDFAYSLGVLHHVPETQAALTEVARTLKPGAPLLVYLYYRFDNRPGWFRALWTASDLLRRTISRLPHRVKRAVTGVVAVAIYWPLSRAARLLERAGRLPAAWPLAFYRNRSFYTLRTDAYDRFSTRLEQRFTRPEIESMMRSAGLHDVEFSEGPPYWCAVGWRSA